MKVAILAGGYGSRLAELTDLKPKPLVEIGGRPILWHIMMHYSHYGFNHFVIALGYKGESIKQYILDYHLLNSDLTVDMSTGDVKVMSGHRLKWTVELIDTGLHTMTGGRIKRLAPYLGNETFMLTWGDGVSNVNLQELVAYHQRHGKLATVTAVRPQARFGHMELDDQRVTEFSEKPQTGEGWINGAFFVLEPGVFDYIDDDNTHWEREPMQRLAHNTQLMAYQHDSFWQCIDTLREKQLLENLWQSGNAPWKIWKDPNESISDRTQGLHRHRAGTNAFG